MVGSQVRAGAQLVDGAGEDLVGHQTRKFRSMSLPCGVSTDSGWNWTPSAGSSRCLTPITTPSYEALSSSSSGSSGIRDERVIAARAKRALEPAQDAPPIVLDLGVLAVDRLAPDRPTAKGLDHRLVTEADPQRGHTGLRKRSRRLDGDPGLRGGAGARGDDQPIRPALQQLAHLRPVVSDHVGLGSKLAQVLDEVVGERVIVVDHKDAHAQGQSGCFAASSTAANTAFALFTDSSYS